MATKQNIGHGIITITVDGLEKIQAKLDLAKKSVKGFTDASSQIGNQAAGAFAAGAATITGLLRAADPVGFAKFTVALEVLAMKIGSIFIPLLRDATAKINEWIEYFRNMDDATKEQILTWTKWIMGGLAVVAIIGKTIALISPLIGLMSNLTTVAIGLGRALLVVFSNPLIAAVTLVVGVIAAAVFKMHQLADELDRVAETSKRLQGGTNKRQAELREQTKGMSDEDREKFLQGKEQEARQRQMDAIKRNDQKGQDEAEQDRRAALQEREDIYRQKQGLKPLGDRTGGKSNRFSPELMMQAPSITGIQDVWKKIQQANQQDPTLRYQQELLNSSQRLEQGQETTNDILGRGQVARLG